MDIVKNGESSTSPRAQGVEGARNGKSDGQPVEITRLVMPRLDGMSALEAQTSGTADKPSLSAATCPRFTRYDLLTQPRRTI